MPSSGLVGWRRRPKHKKKTPSRIRGLAVTVNGEIKSCCCVLGSGVVGWRRSKKKITKNFRKSETAVACQAAASWAGVDGPNKKQRRAVEEKRAGGDGERRIKNSRCVPGSDVVGWRRRPLIKNRVVEDKTASGDGERENQNLLLRVRYWRCGLASQQKKITKNFRKSKTAVACQAAASWAGVDGQKKQGRRG